MIHRRHALLGTAALLGAPAHAQSGGPRNTIAVRIDREPEVIDPAFRSGLQDGNIVRAIHQRLYTTMPDGSLAPDAASDLRQTSPTTLEFTLKPGQMFTDGFGEMTAEDVKFSYERFAVAPSAARNPPTRASGPTSRPWKSPASTPAASSWSAPAPG